MTTQQIPQSIQTSQPTTELPYHRLAHANPRHRWWRPLITVVVTLVTWFVLSLLFGSAIGRLAGSSELMLTFTEENGMPSANRPIGALLSFGSVALMLPALVFGLWVGERRWIGTMSSVAGRLRRPELLRHLGLAVGVIVVIMGGSTVAGVLAGQLPVPSVTPWTLGLLLVTLLVVPIQAAAEEYVFRGVPQQMLGAWLKNPWFGILLPVPLFTIAHIYNPVGLISVGLFAVAAGVLTWRTRGLEAAIALHVMNNVYAVVLGAFAVSDLTATEIPIIGLLTSSAVVVVFTGIVLVRSKRKAATR